MKTVYSAARVRSAEYANIQRRHFYSYKLCSSIQSISGCIAKRTYCAARPHLERARDVDGSVADRRLSNHLETAALAIDKQKQFRGYSSAATQTVGGPRSDTQRPPPEQALALPNHGSRTATTASGLAGTQSAAQQPRSLPTARSSQTASTAHTSRSPLLPIVSHSPSSTPTPYISTTTKHSSTPSRLPFTRQTRVSAPIRSFLTASQPKIDLIAHGNALQNVFVRQPHPHDLDIGNLGNILNAPSPPQDPQTISNPLENQTRQATTVATSRYSRPHGHQPLPRRSGYFSTIRVMHPQHQDASTATAVARELHTQDMIPSEPGLEYTEATTHHSSQESSVIRRPVSKSSHDSLVQSSNASVNEAPLTPATEPQVDEELDEVDSLPVAHIDFQDSRPRRASTSLISQDTSELSKILGDGETGTKLIQKYCCGGGCCLAKKTPESFAVVEQPHTEFPVPENKAFSSLNLNLTHLTEDVELTQTVELPASNVSFRPVAGAKASPPVSSLYSEPPRFVQPHPPYHIYNAPVYNARELTRPGAEKRTIHFDIDVTDYPDEGGVDFKVGGAIGVTPPNDDAVVDDIFDRLGVPKNIRDKEVTLVTGAGRWPTIWGDDTARELTTTRRALLSWCCDLQSTPPTKPLLRLLAEHAHDENEKKILTFLVSAEGQGAFCDLRTGPHLTVSQLLHAFPSSQPPLEDLMANLKQLMPRFYSLSNDPHISSEREGLSGRRLIEMAVTIHDLNDWRSGTRTGVGSGYMERVAQAFIAAKDANPDAVPNLHIPMFRGLMSNPLSREFVSDGPMMLIGAGVGMAPFRGFILNRLKNANCANKIWLLQGVRDSSFDELYRGELGSEETQIKRVVQSRKIDRTVGEAKYVQDEVLQQADIVWFVVNAVDGRVFVCGSSKGMGEGVHEALVSVAMDKGGLDREQAEQFWASKKTGGQYIAETW